MQEPPVGGLIRLEDVVHMPQTRSMKKALRQSLKHRERNRVWKVRAKAARRALLDNLGEASPEQTATNLSLAQKLLDKAARHGVIHPNTAARRKAALAQRVHEVSSK